jgi:hypothetical protein
LLLLLVELLHELLDLPTLLGVVALGVVYRAPWPIVITTGGLALSLVTAWIVAPTSRCSDSSDNVSTCQRLVVVGLLFLVLVTTLISGICFRLAGLSYLQSRLGVPCTPFCSPGALVHQAEELRDIFHIMCGQLLKHLLISHALSKSDYNRSIGDAGDGVLNLGVLLDEGPQ